MTEEIKTLIEKINQEGVIAGEEKAKAIESQARIKAEGILNQVKAQAERLISEAQDNISKMQEKEKKLLEQAARDTILVLRQEINAMLDRLVVKEVDKALTPEGLFKILSMIIQAACANTKGEIIVTLNKEDLQALESGFLAQLKDKVKQEIVLRPAENIHGGFIISYDAGKSQFDFSDKALAEYIGTYLKPKLKEIL